LARSQGLAAARASQGACCITPARHLRISELFLAARELAGERREAYLAEVCAADPPLRNEVQDLLLADSGDDTVLAGPTAYALAAKTLSDPGRRFIGKRVGRFTIQRVIAQGGMGTVYEAAQENPRRVVALKMIRPGLSAPSALRRFEYEAQMLSRLQHPAIAQVFDAGVHDGESDPIPYFAMEFVPGAQSLTHYVKTALLPLRSQLELFATVCDAVHHAHQNGVIHRDLKPENILVDAAGQPKVIDFGVARVFEQDDRHASMHTTVGHLVGTVPYMSPEQARGHSDRVDIRTDIYSLGVVLYQLLTDRFPYAVEGSLTDVLHNILHVAPASLGSHGTRLDAELVTIVLKCLQKDPQRRYQSAGELGRDIVHHLSGEPIEARRDSSWYVLRKTLRRHRVAVTAAAAFVILITASAIALLFMNQLQRTQRLRAEAEAANAVQQAALAETEKHRALAAKADAEKQREVAERQAYIANIAAADAAITANDAGQALKCLRQAPEPFRHWEWHHLMGRSDRSFLTLPREEGAMTVAFAPDGTSVVVGYDTGSVRIWDIATGKCVREFAKLTPPIRFLAFDASATRLVMEDGDHTLRVFDVAYATEILRQSLPVIGEYGGIRAVSPDLSRAVITTPDPVASTGFCAYRYDVNAGEIKKALGRMIAFAAFNADGDRVATGNTGGAIAVWEWEGEAPLISTEIGSRLYDITFAPDQKLLASGHEDGTVRLWRSQTLQIVRTLTGHTQRVWGVAFSPDGTLVASASLDKTVRIWETAGGKLLSLLRGDEFGLGSVAFSPDGALLLTRDVALIVKLWKVQTSADFLQLTVRILVSSLAFDPTGDRVVAASYDGALTIWDVRSGEKLPFLNAEDHDVRSAVFSPDGTQLICGCKDGWIRFVDLETGQVVRSLLGHQQLVASLAIAPDALHLASVAWDAKVVVLWDLSTGEPVRVIDEHTGMISSIAFSPDGSKLATASGDGMVRLWDCSTGQAIQVFRTAGVMGVTFTADGSRVATAASDGLVKIWDASTAETVLTITGNMGDIWSVAFSPDGKRLVTGARDRTVRVWDAETGDELLILRGPTGTVRRVAWSTDGRRIAAGSHNGEVFIWDAAEPGKGYAEKAAEWRARLETGN